MKMQQRLTQGNKGCVYPELKINVRGTRARFFINFAEDPPHRPNRRWTQVRCQQVGNVLRRTSALCKYVTFEPAIEPISASLCCRGQLLPSIIPPWSYVPLTELQRKLFCQSVRLSAWFYCPFLDSSDDIIKVGTGFRIIHRCIFLIFT